MNKLLLTSTLLFICAVLLCCCRKDKIAPKSLPEKGTPVITSLRIQNKMLTVSGFNFERDSKVNIKCRDLTFSIYQNQSQYFLPVSTTEIKVEVSSGAMACPDVIVFITDIEGKKRSNYMYFNFKTNSFHSAG